MIHPVMQLFQVVIFISHYDSSCWFLSHSSFFKGEGRCLFFKKRGDALHHEIGHWSLLPHSASLLWFISILGSRIFTDSILFYASSPYWFITLFLLMKTGGGFFFKTNRGQKRIHLLLLPFMTHFHDADGDSGSSLSFSSQELHHYSDSFYINFFLIHSFF